MGCACVNPTQGNNSFISLDQQQSHNIKGEEVEISKKASNIQLHMINEKKMSDDHQELLNKFIVFVSESPLISFISNEDFQHKISHEVIQVKQSLSSKIEEYSFIINEPDINNKSCMIQASETSPLCYNKSPSLNEYYQGSFQYDEKDNFFKRCGRGQLLDLEGNLSDSIWKNDTIENNSPGIIYYINKDCYMGQISFYSITTIGDEDDIHMKRLVPDGKGILYSYSNNYIEDKEEIWINGRKVEVILQEASQSEKKSYFIISNIKGIESIEKCEESDNRIIIKYTNGNCYDGDYIIHNDHYIPNGKGTLFIPKEIEGKDKDNGKYYTSNWINGKQTGPGEIKTIDGDQTNSIDCLFRFGKIIQSISKLVKGPIKIHKNILHFLSPYEHMHLTSFKTKSMLLFIQENDYENLDKIRQTKVFCGDISRYPHSKLLYNKELINADITNLDNVLENYTTNHSQFIPIVGYRTTGGMVEARFRYNNIFNPLISKMYSTNYLFHTDKDVEIDGVINHTFFQDLNPLKETNSQQHNPKELNQAYIRKRSTISDKDYLVQEDLIGQSKTYIENYNKLEGKYSIQKYKAEIEDKEILQSHIGKIDNVLFAVHAAIIQLPKQVDHYTYLTNPVRHLAIYISNGESKDYSNEEDNITDALLSKYNYSIKEIYEQYKKQCLLLTDNDIFSFVEFDSGKGNSNSSHCTKRRLIALVEIKSYNYVPIFLRFKKYYHTGKFITVKLITQSCLYNTKKVCIDMGKINFFGQIFYLKKN